MLKSGEESYDDVVVMRSAAHPNRPN